MQHTQVVASVYSSETRIWGNLIAATVPPRVSIDFVVGMPAVMAGDSLYWLVLITGGSLGILQFNLGRQSLGFIPMPMKEVFAVADGIYFEESLVIIQEGGCLGFLLLSGFSAQLWKRETNSDGLPSWVLGRTIALDKLLSINSEEAERPSICGFAEDNNMVLLSTSTGIVTVLLESLQFKKLFESDHWYHYYPFEGVYTADKGIGGGRDGAELLQNA
ncbi:unnamed protein product [Alopecurus aequalis]